MRGQLGEELPSSEITAFRDPEGHVLLVMTIGPQGLPPGLPEELTPRLEVLHRARFANGAQVREQWIDRARSQTYAANDQPPLVSNGRLMSRADGIHVVQLSTMGPISEELLQVIHSLELPPALPAPREQLEAFIAGVGPGRWNWEKDAACKSDGETFVFSADRTRVELRHDKEVESFDGSKTAHFSYRVLAWEPRRVRMAIEGETRLDRHGKPVIWDLIMSEDQSSLCWARNDWPPLECTSKLVRCPQ